MGGKREVCRGPGCRWVWSEEGGRAEGRGACVHTGDGRRGRPISCKGIVWEQTVNYVIYER